MELTTLNSSRWLDAIWEPNSQIYALSNAIDMLDINGDGDAKLIVADLGNTTFNDIKLKVFKGADQILEHAIADVPCAVAGFYMENGEKKSAVLAIGAGHGVFIFKHMRPYFKYTLPQQNVHPKEQNIWYKASLDKELNALTLGDDLELLLKEVGATRLSSRTLAYFSMKADLRRNFAEQYSKLPLFKMSIITIIQVIRKDSWNEIACSYIIIGTESGEILLLDHRAFFIIDKYTLGWPPSAVATLGLWAGDGQIVVGGRDGRIGSFKRGNSFKSWDKLSAPIVSITSLICEATVVATMTGLCIAFSKKGIKLWKIQLPKNPLDMISLPITHSGVTLLAISVAGYGIRIYDQTHYVDTIKTLESISSLKYGRLGQEERAMAMITCSGGISVKILKRTANFNINSKLESNLNLSNINVKFIIPKKTTLFIEQTVRERLEAAKIYRTFQQGFLRLRLNAAVNVQEISKSRYKLGAELITLQSSVLGIGPHYILKIIVTSMSETFLNNSYFLICRGKSIFIKPRTVQLPLLSPGTTLPITFFIMPQHKLSKKINVLLCSNSQTQPLFITNIALPIIEDDVEI